MQEAQLGELPQVPYRGGLPSLLTVPEVAAALRVDASTVYRAVQRGSLRAVRLGGRGSSVRIPVAALDELLERRSTASAAARRRPGTRAPARAAGSPGQPQPQEAA